ncbi:MAG: pyruvate kinase [Simkaniaceae bacterium]|nr:pyruvate kinase [Simkaniaceae bacterium]
MNRNRTKILATIGPGCDNIKTLQAMTDSGVNIFRINLSQGTPESKRRHIRLVKQLSTRFGGHPAILADLAGPKIRITRCPDNLVLAPGDIVKITNDETADDDAILVTSGFAFEALVENASVVMADGRIQLRVVKQTSPHTLVCETIFGGPVVPKKGVNFPGVEIDLPPLTKMDEADLRMCIDEGVDWIALSYVRAATDRQYIDHIFEETQVRFPVVAKIEKWEALQDLENIINEFDAVMVARGDLGAEIPTEQVPLVQKRILKEANRHGKPAIIATQMLDSMIENPVPTRAEVSDIANAIFEGADGLLVTGETAIGKHPVKVINTLKKVILEIESTIDYDSPGHGAAGALWTAEAIAQAACNVAADLGLDTIVTMTHSGSTARMISRYRPNARIFALTPFSHISRRVSMYWGVYAFVIETFHHIEEIPQRAKEILYRENLLPRGSQYVISGGVPIGISGTTNYLSVQNMD